MGGSGIFVFPHPVNETSARVVASGVTAMAVTAALADEPWIMIPLAYGFAARVVAGPTLSPLGLVATRVVTPRLSVEHRYSPGPPKRLAQAMGLALSTTALLFHYGARRPRAAKATLGVLAAAAGLEAAFGRVWGASSSSWECEPAWFRNRRAKSATTSGADRGSAPPETHGGAPPWSRRRGGRRRARRATVPGATNRK